MKVEMRTLKQALEDDTGRTIPETLDVQLWMVPHAAYTVTWYRVGTDGKAPWSRKTGKGSHPLARKRGGWSPTSQ